jgi:kumamolisin
MASTALIGSERQEMRGAKAVGNADPAERMEVSVLLRRSNANVLKERMGKIVDREESGGHLSREEFERQFSADDADIDAVKKFAASHHLSIQQIQAGRRTIVLSGTVAQFNEAFGVSLQRFDYPGGSYRGRVGTIQLPEDLRERVEAVLGLDNRPAAKPHFRLRRSAGHDARPADAGAATSFTPLQIASLYNFPPGAGQGGDR